MKALNKGILLAVLHVTLVCTLGAKLLYDRAHRPRIWIKSAIYDPNLPIRGKYLSLNIEVPAEGFSSRIQQSRYANKMETYEFFTPERCDLQLRGDHLVAIGNPDGEFPVSIRRHDQELTAVISGDMAYFLPEHTLGPVLRNQGDELWIEAIIPRKGPPRPARLGIKRNGVLTPLPQD
jgi:hypothetical protein